MAWKLVRDHGCIELLSWRCDTPAGTDLFDTAERLLADGFRSRLFDARLIVLESEDGGQVLMVPHTRRVSLRVGYLTPLGERPRRAAALAARMEQVAR